MSSSALTEPKDSPTAWIRDLVYLAFPEGDSRERVLLDLVRQFTKMDPEDPEWLRYKLSIVECKAMENIATCLAQAAEEQARLRGVTREIADFTSRELRTAMKQATDDTRQLLEDVQASLHDAVSGDAIVKSYIDQTKQQFGTVIHTIMEAQLTSALMISQSKMDEWARAKLDASVKSAESTLAAVTRDFRVRLFGAWSSLLWSVFAGGVVAAAGLVVGGYWLGKHW